MIFLNHNLIIIFHLGVIDCTSRRDDIYGLVAGVIGIMNESLESSRDLGVEEVIFV